jgi:hypothetical protein
MPDARPLRTCTRCGQTDDHPRHVMAVPAGQPLANFHMDCHAVMGCPICVEQIKDADGAQGSELRGHLLAKDALTDERIAELLGQTPETAKES